MKKYFTTIFCLLFVAMAFGQKGIGKISGIVLDSETKKPVEYATISLYIQEGDKLVSGTITDGKGKYSIGELKDNTYKIEVSFIGYEKQVMNDVVMTKERNIKVDEILLKPAGIDIDEVVVEGERSLIEERVDRTIYNADQDDLAKGGDAADVLRKVPLLTVDLEGNVSLRGSSNIQVLINNKPSTILASSVSDALKMIPAEQIKKVEVITSPSAKYDAEGAGGIINIITKRNNLEGYYLNVNTAAGLRGSNLGLSGSLRKGKFGMNLGGFGRAFYFDSETSMEQTTITDGITNFTNQFANADDNGIFARYSLGLDYDIDNTQFLSGGIRFGGRSFSRDQLQTTEIYANDVLQQTFFRNIDGVNASSSIDANLDYLKKTDDDMQFSISTLYSRNDMDDNFISDNLDAEENLVNSLQNINDNLNQELTLQTDFESPIKENQKIEVGAKGIFRQVNSDFAYFFADASRDYQPSSLQPSGNLDYSQNVSSAYSSYTYSTKSKVTFKVGARYERTTIEATQDGEAIDIPNYQNLVPSINMSKTFKNFTTIKLGYNRRLQRPWLQQLNPNVNVSNSQDIQVGNPNLRPQLTDNIEIGLSKMIKKTYLNVSLFGRTSNNAINQVRYPIDTVIGAILTTYENIGKEQSVGTNVFMNINVSKNFSINGGFNVNYSLLEGQIVGLDGETETAQNSGFNYGGRLMSQLKMGNGWSAQAFVMMRGRRIQLQGSTGGWGIYVLGFNKDFKNKKGSFGFAFENFAQRGWNMRSELETPTLTQVNNNLMLNRSIRINFNYRLGQMDFRSNRRKTKSVRNDDLMGGDGGMSSGGGAQQGGGQPSSRPSSSSKKKTKKKDVKATDKKVDINGKWKGVSETPRGQFVQNFTFKVEGNTLTGTIETSFGSTDIKDGKIEKGKFTFTVSFGQFEMKQTGTILNENQILLQNDRGEVTLNRVKE